MSYELKTRDVMESNKAVIGVQYCAMQTLLDYCTTARCFGYVANRYGWCCDVYETRRGGVVLTTGYSPISKNAKYNYSLLEKLERKAILISCNRELDYKEKQRKINALMKRFLDSVEIN